MAGAWWLAGWAGVMLVAVVLLAVIVTPLVGVGIAVFDDDAIATDVIQPPAWGTLLARSVVLAGLAGLLAVVLGIAPGWWLATSRPAWRPVWLGLILTPLLLPPQVYAYAWSLAEGALATGGGSGFSPWERLLRAGWISAAWLWPVPALLIAQGWRATGRSVLTTALLDTSAGWAFVRAVLPSLRPFLLAGFCVVFAVAMLEYPIPHFSLARVYATELMLLATVNVPFGQIIRWALPGMIAVFAMFMVAAWILRSTDLWGETGEESEMRIVSRWSRSGAWSLRLVAVGVWLIAIGVPLVMMLRRYRRPDVWTAAFSTFREEWLASLMAAGLAGVLAIVMAGGTVLLMRASSARWVRWLARKGVWGMALTALLPPVVLGIGFVKVVNSSEVSRYLYQSTLVVWSAGLAARYGALVVVILLLAWGRHAREEIEQASVDGANAFRVMGHILLPRMVRPLAAAGLVVALLAMFEVAITQLVGPLVFPSMAVTLLSQMHYGGDDVVIATCLVIMGAGLVLVQICGWLWPRGDQA